MAEQDLLDLLQAASSDTTEQCVVPMIDPKSFARLCAAPRPMEDTRDGDPGHRRVLRMADGLNLVYRAYPARGETSPDDEKIVFLIHGSAGHSGHLHALASTLSRRAVATVYVPDMRGHGLSGRRRGCDVSYRDQMRDDLVALVETLAGENATAKIVIGGHSAGGGLVTRIARSVVGDRMAGFVLLAPFLGIGAPTTRPAIGGWVSLNQPRINALMALNQRGVPWLNQLPVLEFNQPLASRDGREALCWSFNTMLAFGPADWRRDLAAIGPQTPLLVLVGEGDECFVPQEYRSALEEVAPHGRLEILDDVGHWDLLVADESADAIVRWLVTL